MGATPLIPSNVVDWVDHFGVDFGFLPCSSGPSTQHPPGAMAKVDVMRRRVEAGQRVHSIGDRVFDPKCWDYVHRESSYSCWHGTQDRGYEASLDGRYLYRVRRVWDSNRPTACIVGLHPTLLPMTSEFRLIREEVSRWGCGGFELVHLFGLRCDNRNDLDRVDDAIGPGNDRAIALALSSSTYLVYAWGKWGALMARGAAVVWHGTQLAKRDRTYVLGLTRLVPSALYEDRSYPQPAEYSRVARPWVPRLLPWDLVEQESIARG